MRNIKRYISQKNIDLIKILESGEFSFHFRRIFTITTFFYFVATNLATLHMI